MDDLDRLLAERAIARVLASYARGIDRRDLALVRSCYWPEATDDHRAYKGGVDGFLDFLVPTLARFDGTTHLLGNMLIDVDGDTARSETYAVASHRLRGRQPGELVDYVVGLRYLDDLERRDGEWRILRRVCAFDWERTDPVPPG